MTRIQLHLLVAILLAAGSVPPAYGDPWAFSLLPLDGEISGPPGATIGWGYTITNESPTQWLGLSDISLDLVEHATLDSSIFDFPIVAPETIWSVAYDPISGTGLFQLTWEPTAPIGFTHAGTVILTASWYDGDPFNSQSPGPLVAGDASAAYSATVAAVPEPSTLLLLAPALCVLALRRFESRS